MAWISLLSPGSGGGKDSWAVGEGDGVGDGVGLLVGTRRMDVGAAGVGCSCAPGCSGWQAVTAASSSVVAMA